MSSSIQFCIKIDIECKIEAISGYINETVINIRRIKEDFEIYYRSKMQEILSYNS